MTTARCSLARSPALRRSILASVLLSAVAATALRAHPFLEDRLVLLDEQIAAEPGNARLRLARGSLLLDERRADEALANFDRARELDPTLSVARLLSAQALLAQGQTARALAAASDFLELEPRSARGWRTAARIHAAGVAAGDSSSLDEALGAFDRYFELASEPRPDDYLERAELQRSAGKLDHAVSGLEAGVARLGPLTALLLCELEIERGRERLDAALAVAERLSAASPQQERWLVERARLLAELGREGEALAALRQAESALAGRSAARRSVPALAKLETEIDRLKSELAAPPGAAGRRR